MVLLSVSNQFVVLGSRLNDGNTMPVHTAGPSVDIAIEEAFRDTHTGQVAAANIGKDIAGETVCNYCIMHLQVYTNCNLAAAW